MSDEQWIAEARRQFAASGTWAIPIALPQRAPAAAAATPASPCPGCGNPLDVFRRYEVLTVEPLRWCPRCFGFWAKGDAVALGVADSADDREALFAHEAPPRCRDCAKGRLDSSGKCRQCGWTRPALPCPACGTAMVRQVVKSVEVDQCGRCAGTWFDIGELRRMYGLVRPQSLGAAQVDELAAPSEGDLLLGAARILLGVFLRVPF